MAWDPLTAAGRAPSMRDHPPAQIIAYIDDYKLLMIATLVVIPLLIRVQAPAARGTAAPSSCTNSGNLRGPRGRASLCSAGLRPCFQSAEAPEREGGRRGASSSYQIHFRDDGKTLFPGGGGLFVAAFGLLLFEVLADPT